MGLAVLGTDFHNQSISSQLQLIEGKPGIDLQPVFGAGHQGLPVTFKEALLGPVL